MIAVSTGNGQFSARGGNLRRGRGALGGRRGIGVWIERHHEAKKRGSGNKGTRSRCPDSDVSHHVDRVPLPSESSCFVASELFRSVVRLSCYVFQPPTILLFGLSRTKRAVRSSRFTETTPKPRALDHDHLLYRQPLARSSS
jgi:hypothetical protein